MSRFFLALAVCVTAVSTAIGPAYAVDPSERLLPPTTKGFLAVPDIDRLQADWNATQFGQLMADPVMAPFVEDVKRQIRTKLSKTDRQLRITWEDLQSVYGGEVCIAVTQPWDQEAAERSVAEAVNKDVTAARNRGEEPARIAEVRQLAEERARKIVDRERRQRKGLVLVADVTGHLTEARALLDKIGSQLAEQGSVTKNITLDGIPAEVHTVKRAGGTHDVLYCIHQDYLIASDNLDEARGVLARLAGKSLPSLADHAAFQATMKRSQSAFGESAEHLRWYVEPFGYVEVNRAYDTGPRRRGTDFLQVLQNQGFDAVQGIGGRVAFETADCEVLHQTFVYAPPVQRAEGEEGSGKYRLAANLLDFPNKPVQPPEGWLPPNLSSYLTFNWNMRSAFNHVGSLVDEIAGDKVFDEVIKSIERDPSGPQIDVRKEFVNHLSDRVTLVTDYRVPIDTKSERIMVAVEVTDPAAVARTVNKAMESDPGARRREHSGHVVWEILADTPVEVEAIDIQMDGFGGIFEEPELVDEPEKPLIPNSAVTVAHGHLLIATNIDYITEVLDQPADAPQLGDTAEYQEVLSALQRLGLDDASFRFFTRTDEAYRPTYELMRQGKMPEAETVLGKVLNRLWEPAEEGELRSQHIDGQKMPEFSQISKYLGPGGFYVRSEGDGWNVVGNILEKRAE